VRQVGYAQKRSRVAASSACTRYDLLIARALALDTQPPAQPPRRRMVDQQRFRNALKHTAPPISPPHVRQLVQKHIAQLIVRQLLRQAHRQNDLLPREPKGEGLARSRHT
jgi:hypothetical protein